jgi:hypothetical protein
VYHLSTGLELVGSDFHHNGTIVALNPDTGWTYTIVKVAQLA